ncbi:MAG: hypothetical protein LUQ65_13555 [Candidatus Helarchaeota archaeon]|nr:hypothetical protein [Candidatus Helarchaeota archaeon]
MVATLLQLKGLFEGKRVLITHKMNFLLSRVGICKTVHERPDGSYFYLELEEGVRYGFFPEVVTDNSVEGPLKSLCSGRRRIEVI